VRQSHARWRLRGSGSGALPVGTTFRFTLDHSAQVTVRFTGATRAGTVRLRAAAGTHRLPFDGRIAGRRALVRGRYTVVFTAANRAGVSHAERLRFTIATGKG
jgi:hypothetical protein